MIANPLMLWVFEKINSEMKHTGKCMRMQLVFVLNGYRNKLFNE